MVRQCWLHAWHSCLYVLFTNYNSRTISEIRLTRESSIAWLSILLHVFSFLSIRCCRILSNLLLLLLLFLLLLDRQYYCHHPLYHRQFVFFSVLSDQVMFYLHYLSDRLTPKKVFWMIIIK
jgi:hypothetical protein